MTKTDGTSSTLAVLAIVVLYRCLPAESVGLATLLASVEQAANSGLRLHIVVADNTPNSPVVMSTPNGVEYWAYPENPGLAQPYNRAIAMAVEQKFDWLLTLDQDTCLPEEFFTSMVEAVRSYASDEKIAAIVPHIQDDGRTISPFYYAGGFLPVVLPVGLNGIAPPHASALNSGSFLRVGFFAGGSGYDPKFPLHNSDTRLFQRLQEAGKRVAIAKVVVTHEFSILRREERMSPDRYRLMLQDERRFWDWHMGFWGRTERLLRLIGRYAKGVLRHESSMFQRVTMGEIRYRLLTRHATRLRRSQDRDAWQGRS